MANQEFLTASPKEYYFQRSWEEMSHETDMGGSRQHPVTVDGETIDIWIAKDGKSYKAWATFRGKPISVRGESEAGALSKWCTDANHATNE